MIPAPPPSPIYKSSGSTASALSVNGAPTTDTLASVTPQVIWTAYLSTLSHVPIVNVDDLGSKLLETQTQVFDSLPQPLQEQAVQAASAARQGFSKLPSLNSLLSPGEHYGLDLTIPKKIEIVSPRMAPASLFSQAWRSVFEK